MNSQNVLQLKKNSQNMISNNALGLPLVKLSKIVPDNLKQDDLFVLPLQSSRSQLKYDEPTFNNKNNSIQSTYSTIE